MSLASPREHDFLAVAQAGGDSCFGVEMKDKKSTYGLSLDQLADLLAVGIDEPGFVDKISDDTAIAAALHNWLVRSLPQDASLLDSLLVIMGRLGCGMNALVGKSVGKILLDPQTDIGILQAIKTYGKKLSYTVDSPAENAIAITLYYAALANALVHHDEKISQQTYDTLGQAFDVLIEKKWMTPELTEMFSQARRICQEKRGRE